MRVIAPVLLLLIGSGFLLAQEATTKPYAPWVTCVEDGQRRFIASKTEKTPVLSSPNQRIRAYAEIEARHDDSIPGSCENTARLYLSISGAPFQPVFTQDKNSLQDITASSLGPAAWSSDSRWLFIERGVWIYGSDAGGTDVLLYDVASRKVIESDHLFAEIRRQAKSSCDLDYSGFLGFNARNEMILRIAYSKPAEIAGSDPCGPGHADWAFDPVTNKARPLKAGHDQRGH